MPMPYILLGIAVLAFLVLFPSKIREILRGFYHLFVRNIAETPKGARAIYEQSINKMQDKLNTATEALEQVAGQLDTAKRGLAAKTTGLKNCETQCERLAAAGKEQDLAILAEERSLAINEMNDLQEAISQLGPMQVEAQEVVAFLAKELHRLEREKITVVGNLERSIRVKEMYHMMDQVKKTNLDKLVGMVREGSQKNQEQAVGARVVHENRLDTKLERIKNEGETSDTQVYIQQLKSKYTKNPVEIAPK